MVSVPKISGRDHYFGNADYLPSIIPPDFPNKSFFMQFVEKLFFEDITPDHYNLITPKPNIDQSKAITTITTILRSFTREHNEKLHGCAYLMNLWFDKLQDFPTIQKRKVKKSRTKL